MNNMDAIAEGEKTTSIMSLFPQPWIAQSIPGLNLVDLPWLIVFGSAGNLNDQIAAGLPSDYHHLQAGAAHSMRSLHIFHKPGFGRLSISDSTHLFTLIDGELFNRTSLVNEFSSEGPNLNDADLVRFSYLRWGEQFLDHIQGSCTIILWDADRNRFYCVRDRLGRHPLFYARIYSALAFSPSIEGLLQRLNLSRSPNRAAIALSLGNISAAAQETYYESVLRLEPGHVIRLDQNREQKYRYWEPAPPGTPDDQMKESDLDEFDFLFEQAVHRYTSLGNTGIFLSGGLDSVSIAAVATDLADHRKVPGPLALSIAFPDPQSNEENRQRSVAQQLGLDQVILPFFDAAGKDGLIWSALEISAHLDTPLQNPWLPVYLSLALESQQRGCEVILTGAGGDEWMAVNTAYMSDLMRDLKLVEAARFMRSLLKSYNLPRPAMFSFALWSSGLRPVLGLTARNILSQTFPQALSRFRYNRQFHLQTSSLPGWISADPSLQAGIQHRITEMVEIELQKPELERPYGFYNTSSVSANFDRAVISMEQEEENQLGRWLGITYGHPYWDAELVQFLCRIPPRLLIMDGREKSIVRKTIALRFPELGFEKQKKVMASRFYFSNLVKGGQTAWQRIGGLQKLENLGIIKLSEGNQVFHDLLTSPDYRKAFRAWELLNFEVWLRSHV